MTRLRRSAGPFLLVLGAYVLLGKLGLFLAIVQSNATAVWAPTGIAIAAFLLLGYEIWPAIFVGAFFVNITTAGTIATSLGIATGNTLEGMLAAYLVYRFANGIYAFDRSQDVFRYSFLAGVVSTMVSATIGVTSLALAGLVSWGNYWPTWATWWLGDLGGALIVAPFIILWSINYKITFNREKAAELLFLGLFLFIFAVLTLGGMSWFIYLMTPIFAWGAFRFSQRETAAALFGVTEISLWGTLHGMGPFAQSTTDLNSALILLQGSMAATFVTVMALTAAVVENREARRDLVIRNEQILHEKARDTAVIDSIGDGLIVTDRAGIIAIVNHHPQTLLQNLAAEQVGARPIFV